MPVSLVGTKKFVIFNKRKEETTHFQSAAPNLEFRDLASWVRTTHAYDHPATAPETGFPGGGESFPAASQEEETAA